MKIKEYKENDRLRNNSQTNFFILNSLLLIILNVLAWAVTLILKFVVLKN